MSDLFWSEFAFFAGVINGVFAMLTNSVVFGTIGLLFCGIGGLLLYRA